MSTFRSVGSLVVAVALVAAMPAGASCQSPSPAPGVKAPAKGRTPSVVLEVENNNWLDVHLYVVRDGMLTSLGFMNGPGEAEFAVPGLATLPGADVQLLVLPIGGTASYLSPPLVIDRGDIVDLTIQNDLALSSVTVSPKG